MSSITITPGKQFSAGEKTSLAKLNQLGSPVGEVPAKSITSAELSDALNASIAATSSVIVSISAKSANFGPVVGDKGKLFNVTTAGTDITATLDAGTLVAGWYCWIRKADTGAGKVIISPSLTPVASVLAKQDQLLLIYSDGTNYFAAVRAIGALDSNGNLILNSTFIAIGGTDATYPGLKRNGTTLMVRLADDSADAPVQASDVCSSGRGYNNGYYNLGTISGAVAIDATKSNRFYGVLGGNVSALTITGMKEGQPVMVWLKQDGTGSRTVAWSGVTWPSGTAGTQTSTANKKDCYCLELTPDGVTNIVQSAANFS